MHTKITDLTLASLGPTTLLNASFVPSLIIVDINNRMGNATTQHNFYKMYFIPPFSSHIL